MNEIFIIHHLQLVECYPYNLMRYELWLRERMSKKLVFHRMRLFLADTSTYFSIKLQFISLKPDNWSKSTECFFIEIVHRKRRTGLFKKSLQWMNAIKGSIDSWNSCILQWMQLRQARWMFGHLNLSVFLVHFTITSVSWELTILDKIWIHGDFSSMNSSILHRIGSIS